MLHYFVTLYFAMLGCAMLRCVTPWYASYATVCYTALSYATLCYVAFCDITFCYAIWFYLLMCLFTFKITFQWIILRSYLQPVPNTQSSVVTKDTLPIQQCATRLWCEFGIRNYFKDCFMLQLLSLGAGSWGFETSVNTRHQYTDGGWKVRKWKTTIFKIFFGGGRIPLHSIHGHSVYFFSMHPRQPVCWTTEYVCLLL